MPEEDHDLALDALQEAAGYRFDNAELLFRAMTHPSYAQVHPEIKRNNQRLEFLGDALLSSFLAAKLFHLLPGEREGTLSRGRAVLANRDALAEVGARLGIGDCLLLSQGEKENGGRTRPSTLCDAVEALIGAIFLDSDWETTSKVVLAWYGPMGPLVEDLLGSYNPKGHLQELVQPVLGNQAISYKVVEESGPAHSRSFRVTVDIDGRTLGQGEGRSKKLAEESAAREAIRGWSKIHG